MKLRISESNTKINESFVKPYTGLFWYIDGEVVGLLQDVDKYSDSDTSLKHHYEVWRKLKFDYTLNDKLVEYNYYPRGRVYVSAFNDLDDKFDSYIIKVELDACLNTPKIKEQIANYFNLYAQSRFSDPIFIVDSTHYNCHICRNEDIK